MTTEAVFGFWLVYSHRYPKATVAATFGIGTMMQVVSPLLSFSGDPIPCSGLYRVVHEAHALPPQVTLLKGQIFPSCAQCGTPVHFILARRMDHLDKLKGNIVIKVLPVFDQDAA